MQLNVMAIMLPVIELILYLAMQLIVRMAVSNQNNKLDAHQLVYPKVKMCHVASQPCSVFGGWDLSILFSSFCISCIFFVDYYALMIDMREMLKSSPFARGVEGERTSIFT